MEEQTEQHQNWWQKNKKLLMRTVLVALLVVVIVLIILIILGYIFNWDWTWLNATDVPSTPQKPTSIIVYQTGKTLWDWLQLLIIPAVLAVAGYIINLTISRSEQEATKQRAQSEQEIADDNQREAALQEYINKMSELLLDRDLCKSTVKDEVQKIARVRTLTVLPRLNGKRKGIVLQFLYEAQLINKGGRIVDLSEADLMSADLSFTTLTGADLSGANFWWARFFYAKLKGADLSGADLSQAGLMGAKLKGADLSGATLNETYLRDAILIDANLSRTEVTEEQLKTAKSHKGATIPDGKIHE